jgi:hypothetical protein
LSFIDIEVVKGGTKLKTCFGQYLLEHKRWFLDSFDNTISLSRDLGSMLIQKQIVSKNIKIIEEISNLFSIDKGDKELIVKDLIQDISKEIESKKEYYLFYVFDDLKLYEIPGIEWMRTKFIDAKIKINNSTINFCNLRGKCNLLFEKHSFKLKQYSEGYENIDNQLVVKLDDNFTEEELRQLKENKSNNLNTDDDIKQLLKVRIAEKFEVIRNKKKGVNSKLVRLKF